MSEKRKIKNKLYKCKFCGLEYKEKKWKDECETWCKKYKSCNLEIIKYSVSKQQPE